MPSTRLYSFVNDYSESALPEVIAAIAATATKYPADEEESSAPDSDDATDSLTTTPQYTPYSDDVDHTKRAADIILSHIGKTAEEADVHFLVGGTQTNTIAITGTLRAWEAVIACETGHVAVHETGAIEAAGHKVLTVPSPDGKLTPELVQTVLDSHFSVHMVVPRLVFISNTTEIGTQYSKRELEALSEYCHEKDLLLMLDGARLGSALASSINDLTLADIANLTDIFYIGGTKAGTLFGEALVVMTPRARPRADMRLLIKQRGALLAKGYLIGAQFAALFTGKLYYRASKHANDMSMILRDGVKECGYEFLAESYSNQQFVIFPAIVAEKLSQRYHISYQGSMPDNHELIRLCTSFATSEQQCRRFVSDLKAITMELQDESSD